MRNRRDIKARIINLIYLPALGPINGWLLVSPILDLISGKHIPPSTACELYENIGSKIARETLFLDKSCPGINNKQSGDKHLLYLCSCSRVANNS